MEIEIHDEMFPFRIEGLIKVDGHCYIVVKEEITGKSFSREEKHKYILEPVEEDEH
jgi:hypothetical protein